MTDYAVYTEESVTCGRFIYRDVLGVGAAIERYYATDGAADDAPLAIAAVALGASYPNDDNPVSWAAIDVLAQTERYSVKDNNDDDWIA